MTLLRKPTTRQLLAGAAYVVILLVADRLFPAHHGHEGWLGRIPFPSAWLGLLGAFVLVLVAKTAGRAFIERGEDYYD